MRNKKRGEEVKAVGLEEEIVRALKEGKPLVGNGGLLTPLIKRAVEASLQGELSEHLSGKEGKNRRNGVSAKQVKSSHGTFELETPRDRYGSFEPQLVKKRQTILNDGLDDKILGLFSIGMSYRDIAAHMEEMYGVELSPSTMTSITDKLIPVIKEWQSRPLEEVYPVIFLDAIHFKVRVDGKISMKAVYTVLGINNEGRKEILGAYVSESEGANFWLSVLTDLHARGINDILIACVDGLKGFPEAINTIFPNTEVQLCIVHQIRNSLKYVASRDQKEFMKDLRLVYKADTKVSAENNLLYLDEKWSKKYPIVLKSWNEKWEQLSCYFKYNKQIRKLIYTTNIIEGFHRMVRKFTKTKGAFSSEEALLKLVYCAAQGALKKWTQPTHEWAVTISQLDILFPNRLNLEISKRA